MAHPTGRGAGGEVGIVLSSLEGIELEYSIRLNFPTSNNVADYEALVLGLKIARLLKICNLKVYSDSQLIVNQANEEYATKDERMEAYQQLSKHLSQQFKKFELKQIPRELNERADRLACAASALASGEDTTRVIYVDCLESPSLDVVEPRVMQVNSEVMWMMPIVNYLTAGTQPTDPVEARKLRMKAARYALIENILFKKSFSGPYLRCLIPSEVEWTLKELHEGTCGNHSGRRSLAHKAITQAYFWPYMAREAEQFVRKCDKCQKHAPMIR